MASLLVITLILGPAVNEAAPGGQQPPPRPPSTLPGAAPGNPIVDQVPSDVCTGARLARLERGMGPQREGLRKAEQQLKDAQAGNADATAQSEGVARSAFHAWLQRKMSLIKIVRGLNQAGLSPEKRRQVYDWLDRLQASSEAAEKASQAARAGFGYGKAIAQQTDELKAFLTFLDGSGIADQLGSTIPGGDAILLGRDILFAGAQQYFSDIDLARSRANVETMQWAVRRNDLKIGDLRELMRNCPGQAQSQTPAGSPLPIPPQMPVAKTEPPPEPKRGLGKKVPKPLILTWAALGVAGGVGLLVLSRNGAGAGDTGGGSGSGSPKVTGFSSPWRCSGSTCTGTITIDFPVVMNSGSIIVQTTSSFIGSATVNPTTKPGSVTFNMSRPYNVNCYQTQTNLGIWNSTSLIGPNAYSLPINIPVSCQ